MFATIPLGFREAKAMVEHRAILTEDAVDQAICALIDYQDVAIRLFAMARTPELCHAPFASVIGGEA